MNQINTNDQDVTRPPPRPSSNRPAEGETIIHARLTLAQRDKFRLLGGQHWLQMMVDAAPRQPKVFTGEDRIMSMLMRIPDASRLHRPPRNGRD